MKIVSQSATTKPGELAPMKQGPEQEALKSNSQKLEESCNFIKMSFCVDGDVFALHPVSDEIIDGKKFKGVLFKIQDERRGTFYVKLIN